MTPPSIPLWLAALQVLAAASPSPAGFAPAVCAGRDAYTAGMVIRIQQIVAASDSTSLALRRQFAWPRVEASAVSLVSDNRVCAAAESAYNATLKRQPPAPPSGVIYVFRIGSVYWVYDHAQRNGEWIPTATLDRNFKLLARVAF